MLHPRFVDLNSAASHLRGLPFGSPTLLWKTTMFIGETFTKRPCSILVFLFARGDLDIFSHYIPNKTAEKQLNHIVSHYIPSKTAKPPIKSA